MIYSEIFTSFRDSSHLMEAHGISDQIIISDQDFYLMNNYRLDQITSRLAITYESLDLGTNNVPIDRFYMLNLRNNTLTSVTGADIDSSADAISFFPGTFLSISKRVELNINYLGIAASFRSASNSSIIYLYSFDLDYSLDTIEQIDTTSGNNIDEPRQLVPLKGDTIIYPSTNPVIAFTIIGSRLSFIDTDLNMYKSNYLSNITYGFIHDYHLDTNNGYLYILWGRDNEIARIKYNITDGSSEVKYHNFSESSRLSLGAFFNKSMNTFTDEAFIFSLGTNSVAKYKFSSDTYTEDFLQISLIDTQILTSVWKTKNYVFVIDGSSIVSMFLRDDFYNAVLGDWLYPYREFYLYDSNRPLIFNNVISHDPSGNLIHKTMDDFA